MHETI